MTVRSSLMMRCRAVGKGGTYTCDLLTSKWFHEFQRRTSISYIKFQLLNTLFLSANPITHVRKGGTDEQSAMRNAAACASEGCTTMTQRVWPHTHTHTHRHTQTHRHKIGRPSVQSRGASSRGDSCCGSAIVCRQPSLVCRPIMPFGAGRLYTRRRL